MRKALYFLASLPLAASPGNKKETSGTPQSTHPVKCLGESDGALKEVWVGWRSKGARPETDQAGAQEWRSLDGRGLGLSAPSTIRTGARTSPAGHKSVSQGNSLRRGVCALSGFLSSRWTCVHTLGILQNTARSTPYTHLLA